MDMSMSADIDGILAEIDESTRQIARIRDSIRLYRIVHPETDDPILLSALEYWEERKRDAERLLTKTAR